MNFDTIIFIVSAVVAVFGATMMISQRNTVASVLYLILSLAAQAVLYVQLGALFLGAVLIIVYAGAIMVLFLFVIMLLNLRGEQDMNEKPHPVSRFTRYLVSVLLVVELVFVIRGLVADTGAAGIMTLTDDGFGSVRSVAMLLFTDYLYPFELTGILLLVAIIGAVVVSKREMGDKTPGKTGQNRKNLNKAAG
ncbi:MAG: NADH-quinone oxidoreductase subunit J [Candidatus Zixiibacteriota bacterium]